MGLFTKRKETPPPPPPKTSKGCLNIITEGLQAHSDRMAESLARNKELDRLHDQEMADIQAVQKQRESFARGYRQGNHDAEKPNYDDGWRDRGMHEQYQGRRLLTNGGDGHRQQGHGGNAYRQQGHDGGRYEQQGHGGDGRRPQSYGDDRYGRQGHQQYAQQGYDYGDDDYDSEDSYHRDSRHGSHGHRRRRHHRS